MTQSISNLKQHDISDISLDSRTGKLAVTFDLSIGEQGEVAEYVEEFDLDESHDDVRVAAARLSHAVMEAIKARATRSGDVRCLTCTGACCFAFSSVRITAEDLDLLKAAGVDTQTNVDLYMEFKEHGIPDWAGFVGQMKEKPVSPQVSKAAAHAGETACVFLTQQGCAIYAHRPSVCREVSPWTCDEYEEDPRKVALRKQGKWTLRVLPPEAVTEAAPPSGMPAAAAPVPTAEEG